MKLIDVPENERIGKRVGCYPGVTDGTVVSFSSAFKSVGIAPRVDVAWDCGTTTSEAPEFLLVLEA